MARTLNRALGYQQELKKNYIVNSAMMISQENGTTAVTAAGAYPVDQFLIDYAMGGTLSAAQVASATPGGSPNRLRVTVTSADAAVAAGDVVYLRHKIEGLRVADLRFGSGSAKAITIRFGVKAPAGTYCVALRNSAGNRAYVAEYVISAGEANTDVVKSVTISGDQSGTWLTDTGTGFDVFWLLMAGTNFHGTPSTWLAASTLATANQFNLMGTNGNVFELFDVGLYAGTVAPDFQVPDYPSELALCKRYYQVFAGGAGFPVSVGSANATTSALTMAPLAVPIRAAPTLGISSFAHFAVYNGAVTPNAITYSGHCDTAIRLDIGVASGLAVNQGAILLSINAAAKLHVYARM